jgi:MFS family permease
VVDSVSVNRYRATLAHRDFRLLWSGMTLSALGDSMSLVALLWLVYQASGSAGQLGWFVVAYTAPVAVGGLVAGSILDRFDRRAVLLADNLIRGAAFAVVPLLYHAGALALWHLYAVAMVFALLKMLPLAGVPAMIPQLIPPRELDSANALESIGYGVATLAGPAAAGLLLARLNGADVVAIDAVTYLVFAALLWRTRLPTGHPNSHVGPTGTPAESVEADTAVTTPIDSAAGVEVGMQGQPPAAGVGVLAALRFVIGQPAILATTVMFMLFNVGFGIILVLLPVYAQAVLASGASGFGVLSSAFAGGELAGAAAAGMVAARWPLGRAIAGSQLASGAFLLGLVALPQLPGAVGLLALSAFCSGPLTVWAQTLRMRLIPAHLRGRVFALLRTSMQAAPPLGGLAAAALLAGPGLRLAVLATALVIGLPGAAGLLLRSLGPPSRADPATDRTTARHHCG